VAQARPDGRPDGRGLVVAVDGPSGSGKSSVSRAVAQRLGLAYLDTGATYRAVCWWCLERRVELGTEGVARAARELDLVVGTDPTAPVVLVAGTDVTRAIRESRISAAVSAVATDLGVREELRARQRAVVDDASAPGRPGIVLEGRDTTTVVAPDADVRVLLVADERARLARRALELHGQSDAEALERTRDEVLRRDHDDASVASFHTAADGVVTLDSSGMGLEATVQALLGLVRSPVPPR
jgi:cytidylate kinase